MWLAVFPAEGGPTAVPGVLTYTDVVAAGGQTTFVRSTVESASGAAGTLTYTDYPAGTPVPLSASGCNGRVCIYTTGSGLSDTRWESTALAYYSDGTLCPDVYFYTKSPS